jgi:hypothetical protein
MKITNIGKKITEWVSLIFITLVSFFFISFFLIILYGSRVSGIGWGLPISLFIGNVVLNAVVYRINKISLFNSIVYPIILFPLLYCANNYLTIGNINESTALYGIYIVLIIFSWETSKILSKWIIAKKL